MGNSWSALRRELEDDFLCDALKGRVQYFITHYRKASDNYGRVAIRVDGKEVIMGNPFDYYVKGYVFKERSIKSELEIPRREWSAKGGTLHDEENEEIENMVNQMAINDGVFDIYDITSAIKEYKNSDVKLSMNSPNPIIRMFTIMDRRIGKRTLIRLIPEIEKQPEWLQFFYKLRFKAEGLL